MSRIKQDTDQLVTEATRGGHLGMAEVPVVIREDLSDESAFEVAMVENVVRADMNAMDTARGYRRLLRSACLASRSLAWPTLSLTGQRTCCSARAWSGTSRFDGCVYRLRVLLTRSP